MISAQNGVVNSFHLLIANSCGKERTSYRGHSR